MRRSDRTRMAGSVSRFQTTQWSEIRALGDRNLARRRETLNKLVGQYWKPVYCYLRCKGYDNEEAKDLTQGFFHEIVLGRRLVEQARQDKGRFRTFLLTALDHYVTSVYRRESAKKRQPDQDIISLQEFDEDPAFGPVETMQPEDAFSYVWASVLVQQAIDQTKRQCLEEGKDIHWRLFEARVLKPIFTDQDAVSLKNLCDQLGLANPTKAENMIVTVRRRFKKTIRERVRDHVSSEAEVEQELQDLLAFLQK